MGLHHSQPIRLRSPLVTHDQQPGKRAEYDHISSHSKVMLTAFPTSSADIDHMYKEQKTQPRGDKRTENDSEVAQATAFRQRLLTDDRSDYADIGD